MTTQAEKFKLFKINKAIKEEKEKLSPAELKEYYKLQIMSGVSNQAETNYNQKTIPEIMKFLNMYYNYYKKSKDTVIDIGCGEGIALDIFKREGFKKTVGVEINPEKVKKARDSEHCVLELDFHNIHNIGQYDLIYSSHTLEHAWNIDKALKNLLKLFKEESVGFIILPVEGVTWKHGKGDAHTFPFNCLEYIYEIFSKYFHIIFMLEKQNRGMEAYLIIEKKTTSKGV